MTERVETAARRFAMAALEQLVGPHEDNLNSLTRMLVNFHAFARALEVHSNGDLTQALRNIEEPIVTLPRVVERVGQAHHLLRTAPPDAETSFIARTLLADALTLLGRKDLTKD